MPGVTLPVAPRYSPAPPTAEDIEYADLAIVDISKTATAEGRAELAITVREAMANVGFFYVVNHGYDQAQVVRMTDISDVFFSGVSQEEKKSYEGTMKTTGSYQGYKLRNYWVGPAFHAALVHLITASRLLALGLELDEEALVNMHGFDTFRFMKYYPRSEEDETRTKNVWLKGHTGDVPLLRNGTTSIDAPRTDSGSITVLWSQPVSGLQILTPSGKWKWIKHIDNALVINAGDALEFLSGGYYRATIHRVVQPPADQRNQPRLGAFYFCLADDAVKLRPFVDSPVLQRVGIKRRFSDEQAPSMETWRRGRTSAYGQTELKKGIDGVVEEEIINGVVELIEPVQSTPPRKQTTVDLIRAASEATPIVKKESGAQGQKIVLDGFEKRREAMSREMSGRWVGPCKLADFFKLTMPIELEKGSKEILPKINKKHFAGKKPVSEKAMVKKIIAFYRKCNFTGVQIVDTSNHSDPNSKRGMKLRQDLSLREESDVIDPDSPTQLDETLAGGEVKNSEKEILSDDGAVFEIDNHTAQQARGQLATYAVELCARQHRTHLFFFYIYYPYARLIRFDRAGALVSERFKFTLDCTPLIRFFSRFSKMTPAQRGYDPTVHVADELETKLARERLKEWAPDPKFVASVLHKLDTWRSQARLALHAANSDIIYDQNLSQPLAVEEPTHKDMQYIWDTTICSSWPTNDAAQLQLVKEPQGETGRASAEGTVGGGSKQSESIDEDGLKRDGQAPAEGTVGGGSKQSESIDEAPAEGIVGGGSKKRKSIDKGGLERDAEEPAPKKVKSITSEALPEERRERKSKKMPSVATRRSTRLHKGSTN
ncbi:hypothetical protein EYR38_003348 [Pleurotus pulmonarius]|nr:hypothetical protein EYR38_003348 [Pleurotus pulmonarius]